MVPSLSRYSSDGSSQYLKSWAMSSYVFWLTILSTIFVAFEMRDISSPYIREKHDYLCLNMIFLIKKFTHFTHFCKFCDAQKNPLGITLTLSKKSISIYLRFSDSKFLSGLFFFFSSRNSLLLFTLFLEKVMAKLDVYKYKLWWVDC